MEMAEKEDTEGRCPAFRTPYDKERIVGIEANYERVVAGLSNKKKQKSKRAKPKASAEARKHLTGVQVIKQNLVYIIGLPNYLGDESAWRRPVQELQETWPFCPRMPQCGIMQQLSPSKVKYLKNCKRSGHFARECPNVGLCNNYCLPGLIAAECSAKVICWNCKEHAHLARKCENEGICHTCGKKGHLTRDCSATKLPPGDLRLCNNCYKQAGVHWGRLHQ